MAGVAAVAFVSPEPTPLPWLERPAIRDGPARTPIRWQIVVHNRGGL